MPQIDINKINEEQVFLQLLYNKNEQIKQLIAENNQLKSQLNTKDTIGKKKETK